MKLSTLIKEVDTKTNIPILVDDIARFLESKGACDHIQFVAADMDENKIKGCIREWVYLPGVYSEPKTGAHIFYAKTLNECWRRYICTKELLHLLVDTKELKTNTAEKVKDLMIGMSVDLTPFIKEVFNKLSSDQEE